MLSQTRNRGCDNLVNSVQDYQAVSGHKVLINFVPTWPGGKARVWLSHSSEETTPLMKNDAGKIVPFKKNQINANNTEDYLPIEEEEDSSSPPSSQNMRKRTQAVLGDKVEKKAMRTKCGNCFTGRGPGDLYPQSSWLKCGEKGCKSLTYQFHAVCYGIRLAKLAEKSFCTKYVRCPDHYEKVPDSNSDEDFESAKNKKGKKKKVIKRNVPIKVHTPGAQNLSPLPRSSSSRPDSDMEVDKEPKNTAQNLPTLPRSSRPDSDEEVEVLVLDKEAENTNDGGKKATSRPEYWPAGPTYPWIQKMAKKSRLSKTKPLK